MDINQINQIAAAAAEAAGTSIPKVFDLEELQELSTIRESYEQITVALGQLELQKREVKKNEAKLNERLIATENQEKVFLDKIVAKYGEGTFDVATGVFTPKKV
jgi:hypothetical protein